MTTQHPAPYPASSRPLSCEPLHGGGGGETLTQGGHLAEPPHVEESDQTSELSLTAGAHLELLCEARGIPAPNITWHKDGQALTRVENNSQSGRVLRVQNVQVFALPTRGGVRTGKKNHLFSGQLPSLLPRSSFVCLVPGDMVPMSL